MPLLLDYICSFGKYNAFGVQLEEKNGFATEVSYRGYAYDADTGKYVLPARYYDPELGRFLQEDSYWGPGNCIYGENGGVSWRTISQSTNLYVYCLGDPLNNTDFSGNVMPGDLEEFGAGSDTYKILVDLGNRWMATDDPAEKVRLHDLGERARAAARAGTPFMYGNDVVMITLHNNTDQALSIWAPNSLPGYLWFVSMTCGDWDYKWNPNWQVPYPYFNGEDMNVNNNKNWVPWIYFDGELMSADKFGNLNLGYVGTKMGFPAWILLNFATSGDGDGYWVQKGINMANGGR